MAPLRLDAYIRVSQVRGRGGDTFISPASQQDRIDSWIAAFGHERLEVFTELDESGARADRPLLMRAIERVEAGESDGVVVAKLDRFGRTLIDGLRLIERIEKAGGTFVSVADGLDLATDTGRLVLRIMLSLAEFELDRVRGNWQDAKTRAVMRGIHPSATPPFGYRRDGKGPLQVHPVNGPLVGELFTRKAGGATYGALARWLQKRGALTGWGRENWSLRAVKDILRNDVYLGVASAGDVRNEQAHPALTSSGTFRAAQTAGTVVVPRSEHPSVLLGLLRCAGCRYVMRSDRRRSQSGDVWRFSCKAASSHSWTCGAPASVTDRDDRLQQLVVDTFLDGLPDLAARARHASPSLDELEVAVDGARGAFEQWRDDSRVQQQLGMDAYLAGLSKRQDALNGLLADLAREQLRGGAFAMPDAADVRGQWHEFTHDEQRTLLQSAIRCVFVRRCSRSTPLGDRVRVLWRDEPVDLPARGYRGFVARPYDFDGEAV